MANQNIRRRSSSRVRVWRIFLAATLLVGIPSGCAVPTWLRGPELDGPNAELGKGLRPQSRSGPRATGADARARQIEANLGLRTN